MNMTLLNRLRAALAFSRHTPWVDAPLWTAEEARGLQAYLKSDGGQKFKDYMLNFVLRVQAEAVISESNLKYKCGYSTGVKAVLTLLDSLAVPENYTDGEAEGS